MNRSKESCVSILAAMTPFFGVPATYGQEQYKKQGRDPIAQIVDGRYDAAIKHFEGYLSKHPKDLESMYGLAVAHAQKQDIDRAIAYVEQAVVEGSPFARFLAGPRSLLEPLTDSAEFRYWRKNMLSSFCAVRCSAALQ